jgi:pilus assembly protein FimV
MSYSLSQLDAIGDVDPVAEADVYLAYGRDLQAEEILKEAMRSTPERLAVRTKLLEVYSKRRDTKGFELLAVQLFSLTQGSGPDWEKAQELGRQLDPDNGLYQPGGAPLTTDSEGRQMAEPLGASTQPHSVLSRLDSGPPEQMSRDSLGLDLDLDLDPQEGQMIGLRTQPMPTPLDVAPSPSTVPSSFDLEDIDLDFSQDTQPPSIPNITSLATTPQASSLDFDLGSISLDLGEPPASSAPTPQPSVLPLDSQMGALHSTLPDTPSQLPDETGDPLTRKLELADEFRQIGDMEGARDLLEEVVANSQGAMKAKAQAMLESLA